MLTAEQAKNSVDLMTGSVAMPIELFKLPGRNGIDVNLHARYSSNVQQNARSWNLTASTSILGLGWSLAREYIFVDPGQTGASSNSTYYYVGNSGASRLVQTGASGTTRTFALENTRFWQISYNTANEEWVIIKETGVTYRFGGDANTPGTSTGNSVQWGVKWDAWLGSSSVTSGQSQYALVWDLASVSNQWGDTITYQYSAFADDSIPVGSGGLAYTRASYLSQITDTVGRSINFTYCDKFYNNDAGFNYCNQPHDSDSATQREYQPPHTGAVNTPDVYQDRYETRFLNKIEVLDTDQALLFRIQFTYHVVGEGDLAKRYLTEITGLNAEQVALPSVQFTYNNSDPDDDNLGVMTTVLVPSGAQVSYGYAQEAPQLSARTLDIKKNFRTPRFWFYDDYVVTTWYDSNNKHCIPYAYQWDGRWIEASFADMAVKDQYDNIQVLTEPSFFAIWRPQYSSKSAVQPDFALFHKNPAQPGTWIHETFRLDELNSGEEVELASGDRYAAVLGKSSGKLIRFTWNGTGWVKEAVVTLPSGSDPKFSIAGMHNYLMAASRPYNSSSETITITVYYIDATGAWQTGFSGNKQSTAVNVDNITLSAGNSFTVLKVENDRFGINDYRYQTIVMNDTYSDVTLTTIHTSDIGQDLTPNIRGALVGLGTHLYRYNGQDWSDSINVNASSYRYPNQTGGYDMAYGFDEAVRRVEQAIPDVFLGYAFDISEYYPATRTWHVDQFNGGNLPSLQETSWAFFPVSSSTIRFPSNYVILSRNIYYRMPDGSWIVVGQVPSDVAENNAGSVQISGSRYVSYQDGKNAVIVPLKNGQTQTNITLSGQSIYAGSSANTPTVGLDGFVTFTGSSLSNPSSLTLHRQLGEQATGAVARYVVTGLTVSDGFDNNSITYIYENASAVVTVGGNASLYNKVTVAAGTNTASQTPNGTIEHFFFNGLPNNLVSQPFPVNSQTTNASNFYGLLVGRPYLQRGYDADGSSTPVTSATSYWYITQTSLANITQGRYARLRQTDNTTDGVTVTYVNTYSTTSGLIKSKTTSNHNGAGTQENVVISYLYAYEIASYAPMAALNMFSPLAQETHTIGATVSKCDVTTYHNFGNNEWAPNKTYKVLTNTSSFDFGSWSSGTEPPTSSWLRTAMVVMRSPQGLVLESVNGDGRTDSTLYDKNFVLAVAELQNASAYNGSETTADGEGGYYGFESYEDNDGWNIGPGGQLIDSDPHTGQYSLKLPPSTTLQQGVQKTFSPSNDAQDYVVTFFAKTESGFGADSGNAYIEVSFSNSTPAIQIPIPDTEQTWQYVGSPSFNPGGSGSGSVTVTVTAFTQKSSKYYLLDDIVFMPASGGFSGRVYDPRFQLATAEIGPGQETVRHIYDGFQRLVATAGPVDNTRSLGARFFGRQADNGPLSAATPNEFTSIQARAGGVYEYFTDDWTARWTPTNPGDWSVSAGDLQHTGSTADTATWLPYANQQNYGVRARIEPLSGSRPAGEVGLQIGNQTVTWQPDSESGDTGYWYFNGSQLTGANGAFAYAREWMFAIIDQRVLFWADGQRLIDTTPNLVSLGTLVLHASTDARFGSLLTFDEPQLTLTYSDGVGNDRQTQTMDSGTTVVVGETLYDDLSRPAVVTKQATLTAPASQPLFGFQSDFVTNGYTGGTLWTTGKMEGEIDAIYPADGGYPFTREVFESSPLGRIIEQGKPGQEYSVGQKTTTFAYAGNSGAGNLPANQYFVTTATDANGVPNQVTVDTSGNQVMTVSGMSDAGGTQITSTQIVSYNSNGSLITTQTPNYFDASVPQNTDFIISQQVNYLGQLITHTNVDENTVRSIYSPSGRVRFRMNADGQDTSQPDQDQIQYWNYDAMGRPTEAGTFTHNWGDLPPIAPDSYLPPSPTTVRERYSYLPASSINNGRVQTVERYPAGSQTANVTETLTYNWLGFVQSRSLAVTDYDSDSYTISYSHDNLGNPTTVTYLDQETLEVIYTYNRRGLVYNIGTAASPALFASYQYYPDGSIAKESLGFKGSTGVDKTYVYNSPGWLTQVNYAYFLESLLYGENAGYQNASYFNGLIGAQSDRLQYSGAPAGYTYKYGYDDIGRLQFAENTASTDWGLGISQGVQYDDNGNITFFNRGNDDFTLAYSQGTDQVGSLTGAANVDYTYTPSGSVKTATPTITDMSYDYFSGMTTQIQASGSPATTLSFEYRSDRQRVYKKVQSSSTDETLYIRGLADYPLVEKSKSSSGEDSTVLYIRGQNGLLAFYRDGTLYYVIRDHLGSTRVVFDQSGNITATYDYQPFGQIIRTTGDTSIVNYLYTGQEFDSFDGTLSNGLYNFRARFYDVTTCRFYGPDPAGQYPSPYIYVGNNPVSLVDPTGMFFREFLTLLGAAVGALLIGAAIGALLPVGALAGAVLLLAAYSLGVVVGATYALFTGVEGDAVIDYAASFGVAAVALAAGALLGGFLGMSPFAIVLNEGFGIANGFSLMPDDTPASSYGYYIAGGIAISFAAEGLGNFATSRIAGIPISAVETEITTDITRGAIQRGVAGAASGFALGSIGALTSGQGAGAALREGLLGGVVYGTSSALSSQFEGRNAVYPRINKYGQKALRIVSKQIVVMSADQRILDSRIAMVEKYSQQLLNWI